MKRERGEEREIALRKAWGLEDENMNDTVWMAKTKPLEPTLWTDFLDCVPEGNRDINPKTTSIANVMKQRLINKSANFILT